MRTSRRRYVGRVGAALGWGALAGCVGPADEVDDDGASDDEAGGPNGSDEGDAAESDGRTDDTGEEEEPADDEPANGATSEDDANGAATSDHEADTDDAASSEEPADDEAPEGPREVVVDSDAGEVAATVYGAGSCGVILTPQINLDRSSWEPQAEHWADAYLVVAIDPIEDERPASIAGAIDFLLEEEGASAVILVGASIGGEAAVIAGSDRADDVAGVVALSPGGGEERADELTGEKLFVVAEDDSERFVETTEAMYDRAAEPKELEVYTGDAHAQRLFGTHHAENLLAAIDDLLARACSS